MEVDKEWICDGLFSVPTCLGHVILRHLAKHYSERVYGDISV